MAYSVLNWSLEPPMPLDASVDIGAIKTTVDSGAITPARIEAYYNNALRSAQLIHESYDLAGDHPSRFERLDKELAARRREWGEAGTPLEQFFVADHLHYTVGRAYDAYAAKFGAHQPIPELLTDYSIDAGRAVGGAVGGAAGGLVRGTAGGAARGAGLTGGGLSTVEKVALGIAAVVALVVVARR